MEGVSMSFCKTGPSKTLDQHKNKYFDNSIIILSCNSNKYNNKINSINIWVIIIKLFRMTGNLGKRLNEVYPRYTHK